MNNNKGSNNHLCYYKIATDGQIEGKEGTDVMYQRDTIDNVGKIGKQNVNSNVLMKVIVKECCSSNVWGYYPQCIMTQATSNVTTQNLCYCNVTSDVM